MHGNANGKAKHIEETRLKCVLMIKGDGRTESEVIRHHHHVEKNHLISSHLETLAADVVADSPRRSTALCGELASEIEISGSAFSDLNSEWSLRACQGGVWDLDYACLRSMADKLGALLLCDMAHISGLISAQCFQGILSNELRPKNE
ncbi:Serine hydroxymethyltransferase-like domain [Arabidopsis thaliana x Arabidopsis arenosa]|uniref:Serine hydroxymethyltransferase-like domain n=1 Tax=Arabidopsis thaliana x Arabidopsis arenosa TaxID=1240361 RepID=A0A8T1XGQ4_9BRAS|nr:Serine hydroxymethyltransferase-like domain [Arabidopsis thaliana x Arabidopsis arenosa]